MQSLEEGTRGWQGAVIVIDDRGTQTVRPAAFVFDVPGGVAWVEPSYSDPAGPASPSFHRFGATAGDRWGVFTRPGGWRLDVAPYTPGLDADLVGDALEWFADWLHAEGRTWEAERERVRGMLGDALA